MTESQPSASAALARLLNGYQVSQAIHVAAALGIADLLKDGARSSDDLAAATGTHSRSLYRLLRALSSVGVFREDESQRFTLTPLGECLRSDAAEPMGPWAVFIGQERHWHSWGNLLYSVRTGETAFRGLYGTDVWEARAQNPEVGAIFDRAMTANSQRQALSIVAAYDFGRFERVMDVAGGQGALLSAILAANRSLRGVLFDQPQVVASAGDILGPAGVAGRCEVVGGSFFEALPGDVDACLLKAIVHDWDDNEAIAILKNCRAATRPNGRLLVIEREVEPLNEGPAAKFSDLNMLAMNGGRERRRDEFATLFAAAGFRLIGATPTASELSIIEGVVE
jgi:hypothetical protein